MLCKTLRGGGEKVLHVNLDVTEASVQISVAVIYSERNVCSITHTNCSSEGASIKAADSKKPQRSSEAQREV